MKKIKGGIFIVFEGIDGTGKSTQLKRLKTFLEKEGYDVISTCEPTDGPFGQKIRALYKNRASLSPAEELDLFISDRKDHVDQLISPALANGKIVLCDRYFLSTAAYQGAAGIDPDKIFAAHAFAPIPDLALILETGAEESIRRITETRGDRLNDFEQLPSLKKVDALFKSMNFDYITRVNGNQSIAEVERQIRALVREIISKKVHP
ncbi:MAG: dTMP kinase [Proteobacteria bacterium]|nr:MAG: dTMP kinase [Pseudomonadota bacterium]